MRAAQGEDLGVIFRNFEMNRPSSSMSAAAPETDASKGYASSVINDSSSSAILSMPGVMDHPNFSVAQKKQFNMTAVTLLAPNQQDASVDKINGPLDMFFGCVGALFYIMNQDDVQISIAAMKASGNGHIPLGDVLTNGVIYNYAHTPQSLRAWQPSASFIPNSLIPKRRRHLNLPTTSMQSQSMD